MRPAFKVAADVFLAVCGAGIAAGADYCAQKTGYNLANMFGMAVGAGMGFAGIRSAYQNLDHYFEQNPPSGPLSLF